MLRPATRLRGPPPGEDVLYGSVLRSGGSRILKQAFHLAPDIGARRFAVHPIDRDVALRNEFVGDDAQRRLAHHLLRAFVLRQGDRRTQSLRR